MYTRVHVPHVCENVRTIFVRADYLCQHTHRCRVRNKGVDRNHFMIFLDLRTHLTSPAHLALMLDVTSPKIPAWRLKLLNEGGDVFTIG
jgi:hypothetical protein